MSRRVLACVPQHTPSKSRVFAIVETNDGLELEAVATFDDRNAVNAMCLMLNDHRDVTGLDMNLEAFLPESTRANLNAVGADMVDDVDLREAFMPEPLDLPDIPECWSGTREIDWKALFPVAWCGSANPCEFCDGCAAGQCGPTGTCRCVTGSEDEAIQLMNDGCGCPSDVFGPRWAAALHISLAGYATVLCEMAEERMYGAQMYGKHNQLIEAIRDQPPAFYARLAQACVLLMQDLETGREPVPQTLAEHIVLYAAMDEAGPEKPDKSDTGDWLKAYGLSDLPEAWGDFDVEALWFMQVDQSAGIIPLMEGEDGVRPYGELEYVFAQLPEAAAEYPRPKSVEA